MLNTFRTEKTSCVICGATDGCAEANGIDYIYEGSAQMCIAWRCTECAHVYLNPRPVIDSIDTLYPSNYPSFSGKFTNNNVLKRIKDFIQIHRIQQLLNKLPPGAKFIDIGCGDGQFLEVIKKKFPELEVHGLDWKFGLDVRQRLEAQNIVLHESLVENAKLPTSYFDLVTMNQLIEHVWEPRKCLSVVRQILSSHGQLVLTTPNIQGYDRQFFSTGLWGGYYFPRHLNFFNRSLLERLLDECGLETIQSRSLVAPIIWCYSIKSLAKTRFPKMNRLHRFVDVHNVVLMAFFTMLDLFMIFFRVSTSNQEVRAQAKKI